MSQQSAQTTWALKYQKKNDTPPPLSYAEVNASVARARSTAVGSDMSGARTQFGRLPTERDFPKNIETRIIDSAPGQDVSHVVIVLHGFGGDTDQLLEFSKNYLLGPNAACILVRGTHSLIECEGAYCWSDDGESNSRFRSFQAQDNGKGRRKQTGMSSIRQPSIPGPSRVNTAQSSRSIQHWVAEPETLHRCEDNEEEDLGSPPTFAESTKQIGIQVIVEVLMKTCGFNARNIVLVGHDEGGSAALAVAAACCDTEFGGVVTIGGILPTDFPYNLPLAIRPRTHVLILGGSLGDINNKEVERIETAFTATTKALKAGESDGIGEIEVAKLKEFLEHQLWRSEWTKEAVATFDGGGIRGYGSLLMLRELMLLIAQQERSLDKLQDQVNGSPPTDVRRLAESSFSPCSFPPIQVAGESIKRDPNELDDDQRYLPCHYFTFVGGTSTGGLIALMISRFRMSVHDCLNAYRRMGSKVFGHPRPPDLGVRWHKFNADRLEDVIGQIVSQNGETVANGDKVSLQSPRALCKTIVAARADIKLETVPFLFRSYDCRADGSSHPPRNAGAAATCSIIEVGRATSAAPGYFRPIKINNNWDPKICNGLDQIQFIDGGFGLNNPSHEILLDIQRHLRESNKVFDVFVSFGTGVSAELLEGSLSTWWRLMKEMRKEMTDVLRAHQAMEQACGIENGDPEFKYFRFDGGKDLGKVKMDKWSGSRKAQFKLRSRPTGVETLQTMEDAVKKFLKSREIKNELERLAVALVSRRRLRTKDSSAWERYACASHYDCNQTSCDADIDTLDEFENHLDNAHPGLSGADRQSATQGSRRCWIYRKVADAA